MYQSAEELRGGQPKESAHPAGRVEGQPAGLLQVGPVADDAAAAADGQLFALGAPGEAAAAGAGAQRLQLHAHAAV